MATKFTFGAPTQSQATPFGAPASSSTGFGGFGSFGATAATTTTSSLFGGFGTAAKTTGTSLFGGFGTTTTSTGLGSSFGGFGAAKTTGTGLFGATTTTTSAFGFGSAGASLFGGSAFGAKTSASTGFSLSQPTATFGGLQQSQQQQQQLNAAQQALANPLNAMTTALSMPVVFGDERDAILAKFNQIQALWGVGKGYYAENQQPIPFTMDNPFCRFKTIGYSCLPNAKDSEGLIALDLKHKIDFVKANQQQLVESLHKILGSKPTLVVCVDGVRELPENKTEVIIYIVERAANGTSRRIPATELYMFISQDNIKMPESNREFSWMNIHLCKHTAQIFQIFKKNQLSSLGTESMLPKTSLTDSQLESFLETPPLGIDPIIWEQAKKDNPQPKKLIPVPRIGFSELLNQLKHQEHEAGQHKQRIELMSDEVLQLQRAHATTMAKLAEYKRKHLELGHRVLEQLKCPGCHALYFGKATHHLITRCWEHLGINKAGQKIKIMIHQQSTRRIGYAIEPEEEQLRIQFESIQSELNSPMHLKGRLNELMSQIRMQAHGGGQKSEARYTLDDNLRLEIKQHLENQQNGIMQLINIIKEDLEDMRTVELGLCDANERR